MSDLRVKAERRRELDIIERLENVKRLIQMECTLMTVEGAEMWRTFRLAKDDKCYGNNLLHSCRDEIQLQLLSIVAMCYGQNPDIGEPTAMLEWADNCEDEFRDMFEKCLHWSA